MRQYIIGEENGDGTVTFEMTELTSDMYVSFTTRNDDISNVLAKKVVAYSTYDYEAIRIGSLANGVLSEWDSNFLVGEDAEVWVYMYLRQNEFSESTVYSASNQVHYYNIDNVDLVVKNASGEVITDIVKLRITPVGAQEDPLGVSENRVKIIKFTLDGDKITEDLYLGIENVAFHDGITPKTIDDLGLNALTFVNNAQDYFYPLFNADAEGKNPFRFAGKYYVGNDVQLKIIFTAETGGHDFASAVTIENTNGEVVPVVEISDTTDLGDGRVQYDVTYTFATENTATTFTVRGL